MIRFLRTFRGVVVILFFSAFAQATSVLPLDIPEMTDQAGKIFVGRCLGAEPFLDEQQFPSTSFHFRASRGLKGVRDGEEVWIKTFGTEGTAVMRGFRSGQEYLLFLYPESSIGFTSPVGGGQGRFEVLTDEDGHQTVLPILPILPILEDRPVPIDRMIQLIKTWVRP